MPTKAKKSKSAAAAAYKARIKKLRDQVAALKKQLLETKNTCKAKMDELAKAHFAKNRDLCQWGYYPPALNGF